MLEPSSEPIIQRLHKLTDAINSIGVDSTDNANPRRYLAKEGLLDALLALYDECNNDELKKNNNILKFVEKYRSTVHELRQFRVNVNDFEQKKVIGRGHFGIVQVVREKQTGNVYALKILQKSETLAQQHISFYEEERDIMAKATSPWITHLQHAFQDERHLYILMDFHPGGDLLSLMDRLSYTFSEEMTRFYLAEIAVAIHALHTMGYVHRDIKPDNILIDRVGHIKLADFGSAAKLTASRLVRSDMALGTPEYIAPELLTSMNKTLTRDSSYGAECDFWSLGIMAYEMLFGETPFCGDNQSITFNNILNHEKHFKFPPSASEVSEDVKDLIQHLVCTVEQRLSYNGIVNHRFFLHTDWNNLESVEPPFIPVVTSVDDTSNFDDIDYKESAPNIEDFRAKGVFSGFHLPFVGYTYSRPPVEKKNESRNQDTSSLNIAIPKEPSQLETELQTKKKQLHEANLKIQRLSEGGQNRSIVSELEKRAVRAEKKMSLMEEEVKNSRKETTHYLQKIKDFENTLKEERSAHKERQNKALDLMKEYKERWKKDEEERVKHLMDKVEIYKQSAATLLDNKDEALRQLAEMTHEANKFEENMMKYKQLYTEKVNELNKMTTSRLETCNKMDVSISMKTDSNSAKELNKEKEKTMNLKKDLDELKTLKSELEDASQDLKCRLDASESERKNLESEINTLRLSLKSIKDDNESLEAELKETREMALKERDSLLHDLEVKLTLEQRECYELRIKLQELSQSLNESLATQDSFQNQHESLESKLESTKVELEIIAKAKEDALHELSIVSSREDEQRSKVKELESLLETLKETLNKLETKQVDDVERKNQQKSQGQMELLEKQLKNALEAAAADKEKLHLAEKNVRNTGRELSDVKLDLRSSQRELKQSQETSQFLRERSKELKEQIKSKENEINDLELKKKDLEEIIKKKDADISQLEKKNEETLSETQRLLKKLEDAEKIELTAQSKVDELKKKIVACQSEADKLKIEKRGLTSQLQMIERERVKDRETEASQKEKIKELEAKLTHSNSMIESLKEVCTEQDDQLSVVDKFEERIQNVSREKQNLSNEIQKLQSELKLSKSSTNEEKSLRIFQEKRVKDLENKLTAYDIEIDEHKINSQQEINKIKEDNNDLQAQISDMESEIREIRTKERALEHSQLEQQNIIDVMKGEIEGHIQHIHSMKDSNFKLTDGLEQAISKGELYKKRIEECERLATESKIIFDDKELKLKSTIAQQTKLIDFLQSKVENPPKKKATLSRMFGTSTKNKENSGYIIGPQYRKLEDLLAREKEHSKQLSSKLAKIQNENLTLRSQGSSSAGQTQKNVMEDLTNSPSIQDGHPKERMRHKIPHRWQSYLVVRAGRCAGCLGSVPFSRNAVKCHECGLIAHIKCSRNIANTCGLPEGFANHYSQSRAKSNAEGSPSTGLMKNTMKGWIKVPRSGKASWEKRYACLSEGNLLYYDQEPVPSLKPIKTYTLDTNLHKIAVLHSVPTSELQSFNRSDLPYVLKIDMRSEKQGMTSNPIYIMTSSFEEKKSWISALENVIHGEGSNDDDVAKGTLEMETLLSLNSVTSLDVNTIVYLNDRTAIIGAVEGLFSFSRDENGRLSFRARIEGVNSVFEILLIKSIGVAVIIGGKDNFLYHVNLELLKVAADASQMAKPSIAPLHIEPQISCHLVSASQHTKRVFICAAAANRISIFLWCSDKQTFEVCRQYSTQEPCSCVQFTPSSLIVGAERFYKISLKNFSIEEYLDETDTSLAYAIYGSAQMSSFPVAIIQVSGSGKHEEYLLVFYEFGIFVDSEGRRSREFDLKFVRLPVGIVFCPPYLYILHHNSVEVMEIKAESFTRVKGLSFDSDTEGASSIIRSASKMLLKPRFLGNSLDSKAILLATNTDAQIDIVSLRATFSVDPDDESLAWSMNTSIQTQTYMGDSSETASLASEGSFGSSSTLSDSTASSIKRKFPNFMRASKRTKKQDKS